MHLFEILVSNKDLDLVKVNMFDPDCFNAHGFHNLWWIIVIEMSQINNTVARQKYGGWIWIVFV